jgi:hypothetical protein
MGRCIALLLTAGVGLAALGCTDTNRESSPTAPSLVSSPTGCDLSTARSLVNSVYASSVRTQANNLIQTIQNAGSQSVAATDAGFDLFALLASNGMGAAADRSTFVNAIIPCQLVGSVTLPINFAPAFGPNGAFEVRGSTDDKAAAVSHDVLWGLEPPLDASLVKLKWNDITSAVTTTVTTKRFLAYGFPVTPTGFTTETQVGTIFDWVTIPTLSFSPGVVVGTCFYDATNSNYLIQHNPAGSGGEIVPGATPSFCPPPPSVLGYGKVEGWSFAAVAHRMIDFFKPQPLLAAALGGKTPPGGSIGSLSPSVAVDPKLITLAFNGTVADGKTGVPLQFKPITTPPTPVSVSVTPTGQTPMDGVKIRLIATTNLGATVSASNNTATTENGVATFPNLTINKAGGYRLIATIDGFGQNDKTGFSFNNVTSNGFNLKQNK